MKTRIYAALWERPYTAGECALRFVISRPRVQIPPPAPFGINYLRVTASSERAVWFHFWFQIGEKRFRRGSEIVPPVEHLHPALSARGDPAGVEPEGG